MNTRNESNNNKKPRFVVRNSLLTDLFDNNHIRTVYHLFITTFIGLVVNTTVYDYLKRGEITLGLKIIKNGFGGLHIAVVAWLGYFAATCCTYWLFKIWAKNRNFQKIQYTKYWDWFWVTLLATYYVSSFKSANYISSVYKPAPASAAIVVIEQVRLVMKVHSFIRTNSPKVLRYKPHTEAVLRVPTFSNFLYFLFVPTLIYQENYPRTERINWSFALKCLLECVGVLFFFSFVIDRFLNPSIQDFGLRKYTPHEIILCIFENTITGIFLLLPSFFLILHSWQNLFAEVTRFGDRLFYTDWWTCTDFSSYFRKWNIIVQDWLYLYVYKDFNEYVFRNPGLSKLAVFLISAIVHEWVLTYMFGFFFPLLFVEFLVLGSVLACIGAPKTGLFNVLFWYSLSFGAGTIVTMYGIEYYARRNAPMEKATIRDGLVPRFLTCDCIEY